MSVGLSFVKPGVNPLSQSTRVACVNVYQKYIRWGKEIGWRLHSVDVSGVHTVDNEHAPPLTLIDTFPWRPAQQLVLRFLHYPTRLFGATGNAAWFFFDIFPIETFLMDPHRSKILSWLWWTEREREREREREGGRGGEGGRRRKKKGFPDNLGRFPPNWHSARNRMGKPSTWKLQICIHPRFIHYSFTDSRDTHMQIRDVYYWLCQDALQLDCCQENGNKISEGLDRLTWFQWQHTNSTRSVFQGWRSNQRRQGKAVQLIITLP